MRKMSKGDVREWLSGESLERVDFGNGVTGMDKRCPKDDSDWGLKQLMWKCAAIAADGGPHVKVAFCDYWIDGQKVPGQFQVSWPGHTSSTGGFESTWSYLSGLQNGYLMADHHCSGLYATLRSFFSGMFGSSSQRHENTTGTGPLVTYSMVSDGSNESGIFVRNRSTHESSSSVTDSTYTLREPVIVTRRMDPRTHSASPNGGLSNSARCMAVCSFRLSAWSRRAAIWLFSKSMSSRRLSSRSLELLCSMTHPVIVTTRVSTNPASSTPCSAIQFMNHTLHQSNILVLAGGAE